MGSLERWLEAYGRAWEQADADAAVELFAEEATYQEKPFDEPMRGRSAIRAYWSEIPAYQRDISFAHRVLSEDPTIVHCWAAYRAVKTGLDTKLDGMFVLEFNDQSLCTSLREWWHADPEPSF